MEIARFEACLSGLLYDLIRLDARFNAFLPQAQQKYTALVQLADRLSVGGRSAPQQPAAPRQLCSLFCQVRREEDGVTQAAPQELYWPLQPLHAGQAEKLLYPGAALPADQVETGRKALLDALFEQTQHAQAAARADRAVFIENLLALLQRYTWCLPSACHAGLAGVSLYDHSRVTAALAACLCAQTTDQVDAWAAGSDLDKPVCLLVGGDVSGIQSFIYTITSKGAASALRGRSLYLQYLTDAVLRFVLDGLDLPLSNVLYAGGGHFYLLAPADAAEQVAVAQREVSQILLKAHQGDLYLALDQVALPAGSFQGKLLSDQWKALSARLQNSKLRKFSEMGAGLFESVFTPKADKGNEEKECAVCGRVDDGTTGTEDNRRCPQCRDFEALGKDLRRAAYLEIARAGSQDFSGSLDKITAQFGYVYRLHDGADELPAAAPSVIYALEDGAASDPVVFGRKFLVNVTPLLEPGEELDRLRAAGVEDLPKEGEAPASGVVKPFAALEYSAGSGFKRLGVLRMDVDNMGELVSEGLGDEANLTRQAGLSFLINLFFEGYTAALARQYNQPNQHGDRVYSIYSGGDDLFFVGAWDVMPALALEMRNALARFSAQHPGVHASAGIALVGGKYPLYQAADDAEAALGKAKANPGKNSITFLSQALPWNEFAENVQPWFEKLRGMAERSEMPRQVLQRLIRYQLQFEARRHKLRDEGEGVNKAGAEQKLWGAWNWQAAYELHKQRREKDPDALKELRKEVLEKDFDSIEWIGLAARWADLQTR